MGAFTSYGGDATTNREEEPEVKTDEPEVKTVEPEATFGLTGLPKGEPEKKVEPEAKVEPEKKVEKPASQAEVEVDPEPKKPEEDEPVMFDTDVPDVKADAEHYIGAAKFPVFKVGKNEFYQNMNYGRKRLRFKSGTNAQQYMNKTKYKRPFFISYTDSNNKTYTRRIK